MRPPRILGRAFKGDVHRRQRCFLLPELMEKLFMEAGGGSPAAPCESTAHVEPGEPLFPVTSSDGD